MGKFIGKFLYGSQNYNLDNSKSDKDYKWIEMPDWEDLFYRKTLNRQIDENNSVWDLRDFCKNLMKANPNALELLFSVEQEYFDENLKELLIFARENVGSLIRVNWEKFSSAIHGIAWNGLKRNGENPKTVSRLVYFWLLWFSLISDNGHPEIGTNGEMTDETWRTPTRVWPRVIREQETLTEEDNFTIAYISHEWVPSNWRINLQEGDKDKCEQLEQKFQIYFSNYLTNC